jgi:hypothetical protein
LGKKSCTFSGADPGRSEHARPLRRADAAAACDGARAPATRRLSGLNHRARPPRRLRFVGRLASSRKTRFRLLARLHRAGLVTRRIRMNGFCHAIVTSRPFSRAYLAQRHHPPASSPSRQPIVGVRRIATFTRARAAAGTYRGGIPGPLPCPLRLAPHDTRRASREVDQQLLIPSPDSGRLSDRTRPENDLATNGSELATADKNLFAFAREKPRRTVRRALWLSVKHRIRCNLCRREAIICNAAWGLLGVEDTSGFCPAVT